MWPGKPGEAGSQVTAKSTGARAGPCASRAHRGLPRLGQRSWLPHGERARTPRRPGAGAGEDGSLLRCRVPDGGVETRLITAAEARASQALRRRRDAISHRRSSHTVGTDRSTGQAQRKIARVIPTSLKCICQARSLLLLRDTPGT